MNEPIENEGKMGSTNSELLFPKPKEGEVNDRAIILPEDIYLPDEEIERIKRNITEPVKRFGLGRLVIGMSGLDSMTTALLTKQALQGTDTEVVAVICTVPDKVANGKPDLQETSKLDITNAEAFCKATGINYEMVGLSDEETAVYLRNPNEGFLGHRVARMRETLVIEQAEKYMAQMISVGLLSAGNMSEAVMRSMTPFYHTDTLSPIEHLYKTEVRALAKAIGMPDQFANLPKMISEFDVGDAEKSTFGAPYEILDPILFYIVKNIAPEFLGHNMRWVDSMYTRMKVLEYWGWWPDLSKNKTFEKTIDNMRKRVNI